MHVSELAIYPIKSTRQISLREAIITHTGFMHDRRWVLTDEAGRFITQRQYPELVRIMAEPVSSGLLIQSAGHPELSVRYPETRKLQKTVTVWKDQCQAQDAGDEATQWFSGFLGITCRLYFQPDHSIRQVDPQYARMGDRTGFADGFPFLLTSEASLADLNQRLDSPVPMKRFRPNIVISGAGAFAEDQWQLIKIGDITFRVAKPCSRCVMTTIDTQKGIKTGKDPLKTLSEYRRTEHGIIFGQNLIHNQQGVIRVGDKVTII